MSKPKLTRKQDLVVEALMARIRLGESVWTFESRHRKTVEVMERDGWVTWKSGVVEKSILVWPTDQFIKEFMKNDYDPPRYRRLVKAAALVLANDQHLCGVCIGSSPARDGHDKNPLCVGGARVLLAEALEKLNE